jgi:hypothetical protein
MLKAGESLETGPDGRAGISMPGIARRGSTTTRGSGSRRPTGS